AHGLALDVGARKGGARPARMRALRFGLYATGWDLLLGPIGAVVVALKEGLGAAFALVRAGVGLPSRSARAFLRGCYRLEGRPADRAVGVSVVVAVIATLLGAIGILSVAIVLAFV